jgi:hypothetical protein
MSAYSRKEGILVPVTALRMSFQNPLLLDSEKVERFADLMKDGHEFPPVQVRDIGQGTYELLQGYHRQQASYKCSFTHIPVEIIQMP